DQRRKVVVVRHAGDAQAAAGRSCSDPIIQTFGCPSTRATKALSSRVRFENSATVYTVGLTCLPTVLTARSSTPKTSPYVRLSLITIRSISLPEWSAAFATDPYTNAARIADDSGLKTSRTGSARPTVFRMMPRNSSKRGDAALA